MLDSKLLAILVCPACKAKLIMIEIKTNLFVINVNLHTLLMMEFQLC